MARSITPTITVAQGDDAPDLLLTLQSDATGLPYDLTDKAAFAVLVEAGVGDDAYLEKFPAEVADAQTGQVRVSWIKDPQTYTSYLDDLDPAKRYELQLFLGSLNTPSSSFRQLTGKSYFIGLWEFTGAWQEGSPIYKLDTEDLYMSLSAYDGNGNPGEKAWLVTSLRAATWNEVKTQDKDTTVPEHLTQIPVWNYRQILEVGNTSDLYVPNLEQFEAVDFVITPEDKYAVSATPAGTSLIMTNGPDAPYPYGQSGMNDGKPRYEYSQTTGEISWDSDAQVWYGWGLEVLDFFTVAECAVDTPYPPEPDQGTWIPTDPQDTFIPVIEVSKASYVPSFIITDVSDPITDVENFGTQTVLTTIPIRVRQSYRLNVE